MLGHLSAGGSVTEADGGSIPAASGTAASGTAASGTALGFALIIVTPLAVALWLIALRFLIRAAAAADRGDRYEIPSWLCATVFS